ncbi:MAG: GGDEF domain-containing protein [Bacillota bacterium]
MNRDVKDWLFNKHGLKLLDDVLLNDDEHVSMVIDLKDRPVSIRVLSGSFETLGLPLEERFDFSDLAPFIVKNNTLSEVQGRKTFLKDFVKRVQKIDCQSVLHIPLKTSEGSFWLRILFKVLKKENGQTTLLFAHVIETFDDVPDLIHYYKKTHQDTLTKLFTRETLKKHIETQKHTSGVYGMYIDLDNFKKINDEWGHLEGDRFLKRLAETFINRWEQNVIYYRLGGDEFFVYVYHFDEDGALKKARTLINLVEQLGRDAGMNAISASLGIVPIQAGMNYHALLDVSDKAMYASKERGNGNITLVKDDAVIAYDKDENKKTLNEKPPASELVD